MRIFILVVYARVVKVRDIACPFYHPAFCLEIPFGDTQAHLGFKYQNTKGKTVILFLHLFVRSWLKHDIRRMLLLIELVY